MPADPAQSRARPVPAGGPFDVSEVARRYGVSSETVRQWIASGELAAVNVSRSAASRKPRWRISASAIEAFEARRASAPTPSAPRRRRRRVAGDVIEFYR